MMARCEKSIHFSRNVSILTCSSCFHGNLRKVTLSKIKKREGMLSPHGQFTTKVCSAVIRSLLFSRKESWKNKHLVLGMSERIKIIQNPISAFECNTCFFLLLDLDNNSSHSRFCRAGDYWNNEQGIP